MLVEKNKVVTFHYRLSEAGQGELEDSHQGHSVVYIHGYHGLLKGLEESLAGKQAGDKLTVTLGPEQAYGPRREQAVLRVPLSHVLNPTKAKVKYKPGMVVHVNTKNGPQPVVVHKVGLKTIDVDTNHPYAGKTLTFEVEVIGVREASAEEIAHGHVHGEGGVEH